MRHACRLTHITFALFAAAAAACGDTGAASSDADAIRAVIEQTEAANNAGDVDAWVALFDSGAVYMPPGSPAVTSVDGLRDVARAGFTNWRSSIRIVPEEITAAGDWAFVRSSVTGTATSIDGATQVPVDMKQIVIYRRQADGSWRIARLIGNSNSS